MIHTCSLPYTDLSAAQSPSQTGRGSLQCRWLQLLFSVPAEHSLHTQRNILSHTNTHTQQHNLADCFCLDVLCTIDELGNIWYLWQQNSHCQIKAATLPVPVPYSFPSLVFPPRGTINCWFCSQWLNNVYNQDKPAHRSNFLVSNSTNLDWPHPVQSAKQLAASASLAAVKPGGSQMLRTTAGDSLLWVYQLVTAFYDSRDPDANSWKQLENWMKQWGREEKGSNINWLNQVTIMWQPIVRWSTVMLQMLHCYTA